MKQEGPSRDLSHGIPWSRHKSLVARVNPPGSTSRKLRLECSVVNGKTVGAVGVSSSHQPPALLPIRFSNRPAPTHNFGFRPKAVGGACRYYALSKMAWVITSKTSAVGRLRRAMA